MTTTFERYKSVLGQQVKFYDIAQWKEGNFLTFFNLMLRYTDEKGVFHVTNEMFRNIEAEILGGPPGFEMELYYRMGYFSTDPDSKSQKLYHKLGGMAVIVGNFLKKYPGLITQEMEAKMKLIDRFTWVTSPYVMKNTKLNVPVVTSNNTPAAKGQQVMSNPDPNILIAESRLKVASILHILVNSLTKKDLKALSTKVKIDSIVKIVGVMGKMDESRPNSMVLNQININRASRDEVEQDLLNFVQERK